MNLSAQSKLKILFIASDRFPPFRVDVSVLFAKEIVGRGHVVDWILQSDKQVRCSYQTKWSGCRVLVGPTDTGTSMISRIKNLLYKIYHDFKMFRILKTPGYRLILIKDKFISALMAITASKIYNVKFIYWLSYPYPEAFLFDAKNRAVKYPFLSWMKGHISKFFLYRILLPCCDYAFVQTDQMRKDITQKGIPKEKMTAVPMAVSTKNIPFFGYKIDLQNGKKEKIIVYLGTLLRVRKMDFLLRSFKKVLKKEKDARLYLVGGSEDPSDEKYLEIEAKRLLIDHAVTITGFLPQNDAWQYVKEADVCVSPIYPSPILNCGSVTKLIEYMAMGKAVVANDNPDQRMVISKSNGGICVPYEEDAFAEAILYLLKNPNIAKQMGIRGRRYVERERNYKQTTDVVERKLLEITGISLPTHLNDK